MESAKEIIQANASNPRLRAEVMEKVLLKGDLSSLTSAERLHYYDTMCTSVGLNPTTRPFDYLTLNGKLILYANKGASEQLRAIHQVSLAIKAREVVEGCYVVTATATLPSGRTDESIGAVPIEGLKGESRANALMKCETKSKRRVTLSICGLNFLDESEIESIPGAEPEPADRPWRTFKEMLECFAQVKAELGPEREHVYYLVLGMFGAKHSNEFRDPAKALSAYQKLREEIANFQGAQPETK